MRSSFYQPYWSLENWVTDSSTDRYYSGSLYAGDWKATALGAEMWVEMVREGGRRFMAAWRKEEVDEARHRQEEK